MHAVREIESDWLIVDGPNVFVLCLMFAALIFLIDINIPLGVAGGVPYIAVVMLALWSPEKRHLYYLAVVCIVLTVGGYFLSPYEGELWKVVFNRSLAVFAICVSAFLSLAWRNYVERLSRSRYELDMQREKESIYLATMYSSQHILNNLLNQMQFFRMRADRNACLYKDDLALFDEMVAEASRLMKGLSSVELIDDKAIRQTVCPEVIKGRE